MVRTSPNLIYYDIVYNRYQDIWVVFREDYAHLSVRPIFKADTRKECSEWLKSQKLVNSRTIRSCFCSARSK